jgi:hypothetical protein
LHPHAGEMIGDAALAVRLNMKIEDMQETINAHPTLPEPILEAVRDINNIALLLASKRRKSKTI